MLAVDTSFLVGLAWLGLVAWLVLVADCPGSWCSEADAQTGFRISGLPKLRIHARRPRAGVRCLTRGRPRGGPQAATAGIPVVAFMGRPPVPSALRRVRRVLLLDFPLYFSCAAVLMDQVQPVLALWEFWTRPAERGERWTDPRERELPTGRGPAGRCRLHRPGTSPGGWHAARRQINRVQICTPCFLRRSAPEGFIAGRQRAVSEGLVPETREISSIPGPAQACSWPAMQPHRAAPRAFRGATPRAKGLPEVRLHARTPQAVRLPGSSLSPGGA